MIGAAAVALVLGCTKVFDEYIRRAFAQMRLLSSATSAREAQPLQPATMLATTAFALAGLTAAAYAHLQLPRYIARHSGVVVTRWVLLALGCVFGYVTADTYPDRSAPWLVFLVGFGAVHVPAALILLIKRARNSPKT